MLSLACAVFSWPILLFIFGIFLTFASLIVGGIAWAFNLALGVPSWKVLCVEAIVLSLTALFFGPLGYEGESGFFLSLLGAGSCLLVLGVNWLFRRSRRCVESDSALKPYSFHLTGDSTASTIREVQ